jgi:hypothetical protein
MCPSCPASSSAARIAADAAVHHVARRDDVGAGLGVHRGDAGEALDGGVVVDVDAAVAAGVSTPQWPWLVYSSTHTSAMSTQPGSAAANRPQREWGRGLRLVPRAAALVVLGVGQAEEQKSSARRGGERPRPRAHGEVDGELGVAGHRADGLRTALAEGDEERRDELLGRSEVSRTMARRAGVRRSRRGRWLGKLMGPQWGRCGEVLRVSASRSPASVYVDRPRRRRRVPASAAEPAR